MKLTCVMWKVEASRPQTLRADFLCPAGFISEGEGRDVILRFIHEEIFFVEEHQTQIIIQIKVFLYKRVWRGL